MPRPARYAACPVETGAAPEPETARPSGGDGYERIYLTKEIDGELGSPGARQLIAAAEGLIHHCKLDDVGSDENMHLLCNIAGFWPIVTYGGSPRLKPKAGPGSGASRFSCTTER